MWIHFQEFCRLMWFAYDTHYSHQHSHCCLRLLKLKECIKPIVVVGFGGIIQSNSVTGYWGAGLLTLGLNPVGNRVKAMSDVYRERKFTSSQCISLYLSATSIYNNRFKWTIMGSRSDGASHICTPLPPSPSRASLIGSPSLSQVWLDQSWLRLKSSEAVCLGPVRFSASNWLTQSFRPFSASCVVVALFLRLRLVKTVDCRETRDLLKQQMRLFWKYYYFWNE